MQDESVEASWIDYPPETSWHAPEVSLESYWHSHHKILALVIQPPVKLLSYAPSCRA